MKKQVTSFAKLSIKKTTVARLTDSVLLDRVKPFTDQDTGNSTYVCMGIML